MRRGAELLVARRAAKLLEPSAACLVGQLTRPYASRLASRMAGRRGGSCEHLEALTQSAKALPLVLQLASLAAAHDGDPARTMLEAYRGVRRVDRLATRARGVEGLHVALGEQCVVGLGDDVVGIHVAGKHTRYGRVTAR